MRLVYKRGSVWWGLGPVPGSRRRVRRSTGCRDRAAAEATVRRWERESADPAHAAQAAATLADALRLLIDRREEEALAGRKSPSTVSFYRSKCGHLARVLGADLRLELAHPSDVDRYVSQRRREGSSDHTISKELVALRGALKLARRAGLWRGDPAELLPVGFAPAYRPRTRWLSSAELQLLLAQLTPDRAARVAWIVATSGNWRESERAERADVAPDLRSVRVRGTKTTYRERTVPIVAPWQRQLLEHALRHAEGAELLFRPWRNVRRDLLEACARAAIPRCSPNDLRRTTAQWLRHAGVAADTIGAVLGHADSRMVERVYGRLSVEVVRERLESALGACTPGVPAPAHAAALGALGVQDWSANPAKSVPRGGIEPPTRGFSVLCSTD